MKFSDDTKGMCVTWNIFVIVDRNDFILWENEYEHQKGYIYINQTAKLTEYMCIWALSRVGAIVFYVLLLTASHI